MGKVGLTFTEGKQELAEIISAYQEDIAQMRTGVASPEMVKDISVEAYGSSQKLEHIATITMPSARTLVVKPFEANLSATIGEVLEQQRPDYEIAVKSDQIIINLPQLTEETRQEYITLLKKKTEGYRQKIRDVRHRLRDHVNDQKEDLPENDYYRQLEEIDKISTEYNEQLEEMYEKKSKALQQV